MLRRAPTTISLTQADIEQWEVDRQRKLHEAAQKLGATLAPSKPNAVSAKPKDQKQKTKQDRIMGGTGQDD
ncbi:hypothetical protein BDW02DRAFT_493160 [Decorospora gaudefroyi]|uniref:Anaphase-promoting complex subunit CDC26 n=1 Tax=Decorospora gaudefroyi TaxID=184978 RepID=A0A6A5KLQ1_9PLEO|nr:hypothetical protein BDW02DRAFT_493160 [Decorospora gaudefroyi]